MSAAPDVVAVVNTSPDVIALLRHVLQQAGLVVVSAYTHEIRDGAVDVDAFIRQHEPRVVVYDVSPPYAENWRLLEHIRAMTAMQKCRFVITSMNARHVESLAGKDERIYEVVGKPYDLGQIVTAVKEALRARPTR